MNDTPLPYVALVIVPVTEIIDIDRPESVIIDHVELIVPVLPRRSTPSRSHVLMFLASEVHSDARHAGQGHAANDLTCSPPSETSRGADTPRDSGIPHSPALSRNDLRRWRLDEEVGVSTTTRRDCAQLNLRMEPAERDRIRAAIPRGSLNPVVIQLIMDYVQTIEAQSSRLELPMEDSAA